jgi:protein-tyrosine phosphatase
MNMLFICTANISRSFLAEMLLRHEIDQKNIKDIFVSSAGMNAAPGYPPDSKMIEYLLNQNKRVVDHASRQVRQEDVDGADCIFVMEKKQADEIIRRWPQAAEKVELLGSYVSANSAADDIMDPYGRSSYHYRLAQSQISLAIDKILQNLKRLRGE